MSQRFAATICTAVACLVLGEPVWAWDPVHVLPAPPPNRPTGRVVAMSQVVEPMPPAQPSPIAAPRPAPAQPPRAPLPPPMPPDAAYAAPAAPAMGQNHTLAEFEALAMGNNPTLAQAAARVRAIRGKYTQAGLHPNPVLGYSGEDIGEDGSAGKHGLFISQEVVTAGKLRLAQATVSHEIRQAMRAEETQRFRVLNDTRTAFYEVLIAQRTVSLYDELVAFGNESLRSTRLLEQADQGSPVDVLQAKVLAETTMLERADAEYRLLAAWRGLVTVVGVPDMPPRRLPDMLATPAAQWTWDEALGRLLAESPELAEARAAVSRASCQVQRECAGRVPNLQLQAGVQYDTGGQRTVTGIEVGLPLMLFNRNQGNIRQAQAELAAAHKEVVRVELDLRQRLATAFREYAAARNRVDQYAQVVVSTAKEARDSVDKLHKGGQVSYLTLLTAQQTYARVRLAQVESLSRLWTSSARIDGMLLEGGL
ncbi:MAG: TolC family protein [Planctomycetes bacterium]|nr:TolC family protein [Planctomycetota bacterium]